MIQRVQSLHLLLAALVQLLFATGTYFTYQMKNISYCVTGSGVFNSSGEKTGGDMKTLILGIGISLLALISIFLFKNRKQQIKLSKICGLLTMAEIVFVIISYVTIKELPVNNFSIGYVNFILPISTLLFFLSAKAIKKDDELVRSVDRIR
jgi:LPXTG-motif cell wall-anchored protein